jgi:hypothetical protein
VHRLSSASTFLLLFPCRFCEADSRFFCSWPLPGVYYLLYHQLGGINVLPTYFLNLFLFYYHFNDVRSIDGYPNKSTDKDRYITTIVNSINHSNGGFLLNSFNINQFLVDICQE